MRAGAIGAGGAHLRQSMPLVTLLALMILIGLITPEFLTLQTLLVLASDTATLFVLAVGVSFVIMLGGIDLSIQSVASLSSVIVALDPAALRLSRLRAGDSDRHRGGRARRACPRQAAHPLLHCDARDRRHRGRHRADHLGRSRDHDGRQRARLHRLDHRRQPRACRTK